MFNYVTQETFKQPLLQMLVCPEFLSLLCYIHQLKSTAPQIFSASEPSPSTPSRMTTKKELWGLLRKNRVH